MTMTTTAAMAAAISGSCDASSVYARSGTEAITIRARWLPKLTFTASEQPFGWLGQSAALS